jgi:hypothetical protein
VDFDFGVPGFSYPITDEYTSAGALCPAGFREQQFVETPYVVRCWNPQTGQVTSHPIEQPLPVDSFVPARKPTDRPRSPTAGPGSAGQ